MEHIHSRTLFVVVTIIIFVVVVVIVVDVFSLFQNVEGERRPFCLHFIRYYKKVVKNITSDKSFFKYN